MHPVSWPGNDSSSLVHLLLEAWQGFGDENVVRCPNGVRVLVAVAAAAMLTAMAGLEKGYDSGAGTGRVNTMS